MSPRARHGVRRPRCVVARRGGAPGVRGPRGFTDRGVAQPRAARPDPGREEGAAMIEAAFMLFFLSFVLMFLLYGQTLYETMTRTLEDLRAQWRERSALAEYGSFKKVEVRRTALMEVSGVIAEKLDANPVRVPLELSGYAGSYAGVFKNKFARHGKSDRTINE